MSVPHRRFVVMAAVLLAVAAAGLGVAAGTGARGVNRAHDGPLAVPFPHGWATTDPVGRAFTDGMEVLRLGGNRPAVLEAVRLVGDEDLELIGVKLAPPERTDRGFGALMYLEGFPPHDDPDLGDTRLVDAVGATITPLSEDPAGWELLIGIRATGDGYHVRTGVEIDYRVGDDEFTTRLPAHLAVCTSRRFEVGGECPAPPDGS